MHFLRAPIILFFGVLLSNFAFAQSTEQARQGRQNLPPFDPKEISITEHLGETVSIKDLSFKNEAGETVVLGSYFGTRKPVILNLVYYECPSLCGLVLQGILKGLKDLEWTPGSQFEIVSVSIDPKEGPELAASKKASFLEEYGRPAASPGWHFLTGKEDQIRKLANQVGFGYRLDPKTEEYAHSAALFILTPQGKISRYLYGVDYTSKDLRLALTEASGGKIGTVIDRLLMFCYRYDPVTRRYSLVLTRVMQIACLLTFLVVGGYVALYWLRVTRVEATQA